MDNELQERNKPVISPKKGLPCGNFPDGKAKNAKKARLVREIPVADRGFCSTAKIEYICGL